MFSSFLKYTDDYTIKLWYKLEVRRSGRILNFSYLVGGKFWNLKTGNVLSHCQSCGGDEKEFIHGTADGHPWGALNHHNMEFRLFRCRSCNSVALGVIKVQPGMAYPKGGKDLVAFFRMTEMKKKAPQAVPAEITNTLHEADMCYSARCFRASLHMYTESIRTILLKNGVATNSGLSVTEMLELAVKQGKIKDVDSSVLQLIGDTVEPTQRDEDVPDMTCVRTLARVARQIVHSFYQDDKEGNAPQMAMAQ